MSIKEYSELELIKLKCSELEKRVSLTEKFLIIDQNLNAINEELEQRESVSDVSKKKE